MKIILLICALTVLFSSHSFAQDAIVEEKKIAPLETVPLLPALSTARAPYRYFGSLNYAFLDIPIFAKYGATVGYISGPNHIWELEYMTGSVGTAILFADIGSITDTKISLQRRVYYGGSFNITYGLTYFNFSAKLGDDLMNNVSNNTYPSLDMVDIQAYGATFGIGNTWTFRKNITVGIDWFSIAQPLLVTKKEAPYLDYATDPSDKDDVDTAVNIISYLPRISIIQLHIGYMF